ncbi:TPA: 30S ribosomal protein S17 [Candidatus Woesearchaeota archaeon]|nr:30S ribosomal protein S17 [Candidatus Woesearchaeota archaeon]
MTGDKSSAGTQDVVQCSDVNCPIHGNLRIHGRRLAGVVASAKMRRTASLVIERTVKIAKYDRYERRRSSINAHNPECISAREGELVEIVECRPLSKTKHFVIVRRVQ